MAFKGRGPPFVEVHGELWLNLAFDMPPLGYDPREGVAARLRLAGCGGDLLILRRIGGRRSRLLRQRWQAMQHELWGLATAK